MIKMKFSFFEGIHNLDIELLKETGFHGRLSICMLLNKAPRRKQRGICCYLQSAGFQPAFAPRGGN